MKEQLYTIPVNDAYAVDCECPICVMYNELEKNAIEFTMGPSYMEDDLRMVTDKMGFCKEHMQQIMNAGNKLGAALVLHTHMRKINKDIEQLANSTTSGSFFKKKDNSALINYLKTVNESCYVCNRIEDMFNRYIRTVHYLWEKDEVFRAKYKTSKGMCVKHYQMLLEQANKNLSGKSLDEFVDVTNKLFLENMNRMADDIEWFTDKFDYRHKDEPWKNSKDALQRSVHKLTSDMSFVSVGEDSN